MLVGIRAIARQHYETESRRRVPPAIESRRRRRSIIPVATPETRYARSGDVHIAYQVFGAGELDLVLIPGYVTHVELVWEHPPAALFLERLASFARVITFDRRGSGLSDRVPEPPTLEQRMDDVRAVMDAAGSERAALVGISEGVTMGILFAATYPERVQALVCSGGMARSTWAEDYPWANDAQALFESGYELLLPTFGDGSLLDVAAPSQSDNEGTRAFFARMQRASGSPGMLAGLVQMFIDLDVRDVVPSVHVPALVLHRTRDRLVNIGNGRWLAEHLPNARLVELDGDDHVPWYEGTDEWLGEVEEFLTGARAERDRERILATVMFTDIVGSTKLAAELGDRRWREILERHHELVRDCVAQSRGRPIKSIGDGFLATFDGPARGIRCAQQIEAESRPLGISVRAGLHTGECEMLADDIGGIAVHIAARVSALAGGDEVLVSRTVRDLVAGSGLEFEDRGRHALKGVPDEWDILAVSDS
jgi:class 3 adenylate cyclase